jgi:hypothetical protein
MAPTWLTVTAWAYLSACFSYASIVSCDIVFNNRRQPMGVMNFAFPITALYFGPTPLAEYVGDYIVALAFGIIFQLFAIAPMCGLGLTAASNGGLHLADRIRSRPLRLDSDHGLRALPSATPPEPSSAAYWLLMQVGMIIGYFTSCPQTSGWSNAGIKVLM